jgi:hypothetical protein
MVRNGVQEVVAEEPEPARVCVAEPPRRLDDLVENRLEALPLGHSPQNVADRALLLAQFVELSTERRLGL